MDETISRVTTPGSPLVKNLSIAILKLSESGELRYLHDKWWASSCLPSERTRLSQSLQPHDLLGPFLFLAVGSGVGLLLALTELLWRARNQTKGGKVGSSGLCRCCYDQRCLN